MAISAGSGRKSVPDTANTEDFEAQRAALSRYGGLRRRLVRTI
jgi:hypothetical protein